MEGEKRELAREKREPLMAYKFEAARQKRFAAGSGLPLKISTFLI